MAKDATKGPVPRAVSAAQGGPANQCRGDRRRQQICRRQRLRRAQPQALEHASERGEGTRADEDGDQREAHQSRSIVASERVELRAGRCHR